MILSPAMRILMRSQRGNFKGLKPIRVKQFTAVTITSSAATSALSLADSIVYAAGTFPEATQFGVLYDEVRLITVKCHYLFSYSTPGTNTEQAVCNMALAFDPTVAAPATSYACLQESFNSGPLINIVGNAGGIGTVVTHPMGRMGTLAARAPKLAPITGADCPGSAWFTVDSATPTTLAVCLAYNAPLLTGGISTFTRFYEIDVEMRLRT